MEPFDDIVNEIIAANLFEVEEDDLQIFEADPDEDDL